MRRGLLILVFLSLLLFSCMAFAQEVEVSVAINNQFVQDNANHYIIDGQIYVVARVMAEAAGGVVTWIPETQELQIQYLEKTFRLQVSNPIAYATNNEKSNSEDSITAVISTDGAAVVLPADEETPKGDAAPEQAETTETTEVTGKDATEPTEAATTEVAPTDLPVTELTLSRAPFVKNGKTYVPIQFITENFGLTAKWFEHSYTLHLYKEGYEVPMALRYQRPYTDVDLLWLARIIQVESPSGSQLKKMAVANVVLNRVKSPRFPNTIKEVIFSPNQFPPTKRASFLTLEPSKESIMAAKRALEGNNPIEGCLFFNNRPFSGKKADFYKKIEGDYFYK